MADVTSSPISEYGRHLSTQQSHNDVIIELVRAIKDRNMEVVILKYLNLHVYSYIKCSLLILSLFV